MAAFDLTASLARAETRLARPLHETSTLLPTLPAHTLPEEVKSALLNLDVDDADCVAADDIVFYAFNFGSTRAVSYASALPISALVQAASRSGWRPKSRALLRAVIDFRGQA